MTGPLPTLLMIDDNAGDCVALEEALREAREPVAFASLGDGAVALRQLRQAQRSLPAVVVLDLRLPGLDGLQTLRGIAGEPRLRAVPVVVLTSSDRASDRAACAAAGARDYLLKPLTWSQYPSLVARLAPHWRRAAQRRDAAAG